MVLFVDENEPPAPPPPVVPASRVSRKFTGRRQPDASNDCENNGNVPKSRRKRSILGRQQRRVTISPNKLPGIFYTTNTEGTNVITVKRRMGFVFRVRQFLRNDAGEFISYCTR